MTPRSAPLKVALLGPYPSRAERAGGLAGGVDAVVLALAQGLARNAELKVHVVTAVPGLAAPAVEQEPGLAIHQAPHPRGDRLLWHYPLVRQLGQILSEIDPDVVHAHQTGPYAAAALGSGRPNVITPHGVIFRETALALSHGSLGARIRWTLDAWYERWVLRRARDLIAISPYLADEFRPFTRAQFHPIENPIADHFFDAVHTEDTAPNGGPLLVCVARVIPRKDILTLLAAFAQIAAAVPGAQLAIAGQTDADPDYFAACLATANRLGVADRVRFLGNLHGETLAQLYASATLVILTSRQETAPVTIAEAMAAGRPIVATAAGGVPYMVRDGETGFVTQPGDAGSVAERAIELLADVSRRDAFGQAARAAALDRFKLDAIVAQTITLYKRLSAGAKT